MILLSKDQNWQFIALIFLKFEALNQENNSSSHAGLCVAQPKVISGF